jgi:hypothetical protein
MNKLHRYIILLLFLMCSYTAKGQDLIVTTTGDSLHCKIMEVRTDAIRFRFGVGNPIDIKRTEVSSYKYNFEAPPIDPQDEANEGKQNKTPKTGKSKTGVHDKVKPEYPKFYAALGVGVASYGSVKSELLSLGDVSGMPVHFSVDGAYFFSRQWGAGLKINVSAGNVAFGDALSYSDRTIFWGPVLHGRWGKNNIAFTANAGVGGLTWKMTDVKYTPLDIKDISKTSVGGYLAAGVEYMFGQHFGMSLQVQSFIGSVKTDFFERNATRFGGALGFNFKF